MPSLMLYICPSSALHLLQLPVSTNSSHRLNYSTPTPFQVFPGSPYTLRRTDHFFVWALSHSPVTLYRTYPFTNSIHQQAPAVLLLTSVLNYPPLFISFTTAQLNPWHHLWSCWSQYSPNSPLTFHPAPSTLFRPILHAASRVIFSKCLRISNLL